MQLIEITTIHFDMPIWIAGLIIVFIVIAFLAAYWWGTTLDEREQARAYRKRMEYLESKLPRVQKARVS